MKVEAIILALLVFLRLGLVFKRFVVFYKFLFLEEEYWYSILNVFFLAEASFFHGLNLMSFPSNIDENSFFF